VEILHEMHRDINTGFMVREMIESGYYDEGFQYFGVAYWRNNDAHCIISSDEISVCAALEQMMLQGIIVTPVLEIIRRLKLSEAEREQSLLRLQEELKQKLFDTFTPEYFSLLTKFGNEPSQNTAFLLLENYRNKLNNNATDNKWNAFAGLVQTAMSAKLLNAAGYNTLLESIDSSTSNLDQSIQYHTMTGFAYLDDLGQCQYCANGYRPKTIEKKFGLAEQKILSTPILEYRQNKENNPDGQVNITRNDFLLLMTDIFDKDYLTVLQQLQSLPAAIKREQFSDMLEIAAPALTLKAIKSISVYGFLWHVL